MQMYGHFVRDLLLQPNAFLWVGNFFHDPRGHDDVVCLYNERYTPGTPNNQFFLAVSIG